MIVWKSLCQGQQISEYNSAEEKIYTSYQYQIVWRKCKVLAFDHDQWTDWAAGANILWIIFSWWWSDWLTRGCQDQTLLQGPVPHISWTLHCCPIKPNCSNTQQRGKSFLLFFSGKRPNKMTLMLLPLKNMLLRKSQISGWLLIAPNDFEEHFTIY